MKKLIALILAIAMVFSMASVLVYAADTTEDESLGILNGGHGNTESDEEIEEEYYSILNLFEDLLNRINLLLEYIMTVFFPDYKGDLPQIEMPA